MKAEINKEGVLILSAETETESFAIGCWLNLPPDKQVIRNGIGLITYSFNALVPPVENSVSQNVKRDNDDLPF